MHPTINTGAKKCMGISPHKQPIKPFLHRSGYLLIQFNSDKISPEVVSDPTGWGLSPTRLPPFLIPITSLRLIFLYFWSISYKLGFLQPSRWVQLIYYGTSQKLRETCVSVTKDITRVTDEKITQGQDHRKEHRASVASRGRAPILQEPSHF